MISTSDFKRGMGIKIDNNIYTIVQNTGIIKWSRHQIFYKSKIYPWRIAVKNHSVFEVVDHW